jgi:AraC-like DNA-binding protein
LGAAAIQKAYEVLIERYSEDVSLDALASVARLSRFHLISAFRKRYGLPPHAFQLAVRIEKAKAMVAEGMSGTEIAHTLGFSDHAHLTLQTLARYSPAIVCEGDPSRLNRLHGSRNAEGSIAY